MQSPEGWCVNISESLTPILIYRVWHRLLALWFCINIQQFYSFLFVCICVCRLIKIIFRQKKRKIMFMYQMRHVWGIVVNRKCIFNHSTWRFRGVFLCIWMYANIAMVAMVPDRSPLGSHPLRTFCFFTFLFHGDGLDPCLLYNVTNLRP